MTANTQLATKPEQEKRQTLGIVFLILFLDLMGFSIIFPLFPDMLDYYLNEKRDHFGILGHFVSQLEQIVPKDLANPTFFITILFGGILGSLYSILQFICAPFWGHWSDRLGRKPILIITLSFTLVSYFAWFFAGDFWLLVAARIIGGIMSGNISVATAAISDITSREQRAKGMALVGVAFGLGFILGPAIGGLLAQWNLLEVYPELESWGINPFSVPAAMSILLTCLNLIWTLKKLPETLSENVRNKASVSSSRIFSLLSIENNKIQLACWVSFIFMLGFSGMEFTLTFLAVERFNYTPIQNGLKNF